MIKVKFKIFAYDGCLYAAGQDIGVYICDKTWDMLVKDINEAVELYYNLPRNAKFKLVMETYVNSSEIKKASRSPPAIV